MEKEGYMQIALKLAERARGMTSPNPMVGCVIVKNGKIVGKGFHQGAGSEHAEVKAIKDAGIKTFNSTMYVSLEPCSHWGRTPPCTKAIAEAGIKEVIIAMRDPNPLVYGHNELKSKGIKTKMGLLRKEAEKLNEAYNKYMKSKMPFVILKTAISLDGKIATRGNDSKYVSGVESRTYVHRLRSEVDAVMVGINTVLIDDPKLTPRLVKGKDPFKIVVDSGLKIPKNCNLMKNPEKLLIATTGLASKIRIRSLESHRIKIIVCKAKKGMVDLKDLLLRLGKLQFTSIMIEGGSKLNTSAIKERVVDKMIIFITPKVVGKGLEFVGDLGTKNIKKAIMLKYTTSRRLGADALVEGYL
jgi:diaminohydroxyphosphoribosylaminopyrimidine deaminase/5-amino-6-(5-phosphoribosylamino)uracil reductase